MGFPFNYVCSESAIEVRIGSWACTRLPYDKIQSVRLTSYAFRSSEHYPNLWPWPQKYVLIAKKQGLIKNFVITPDRPESFIDELASKSGVTDISTVDPHAGKTSVRVFKRVHQALAYTGLTLAFICLAIACVAALAAVAAAIRSHIH